MAYKRRKTSLNLKTASLETLQKHLAEVQARIASLDSSFAECQQKVRQVPSELNSIRNDLTEIDSKLLKLREIKQPKKGFIAKIFNLTEQPLQIKTEISSLETQRYSMQKRQRELERLQGSMTSLVSSIESARSWSSKLEEAIDRKQRKKDSLVELRAAAAANSNETRKVGSSVKRKLTRQPWCPYCGGPLGSDPHADHIYPVSKGGRSVPRNMVYVCSDCNASKRDLTLHGFMRKYCLDRVAIEDRLEELGKEY